MVSVFPFPRKPSVPLYVAPPERKSTDYQAHERQFQWSSSFDALFSVKDPDTKWTSPADYKRHVERIYFECAVSRACIDKRADGIASVVVQVDAGNPAITGVFEQPNPINVTFSELLRVVETELSLGGDAWLFWDDRVPGLPQLRVLRQDFIHQDPKNRAVTYIPGRANGTGIAELRFHVEGGITIRAEHSQDGKSWRPIKGHLFHIMRFNPLSSGQGSGDGDAVSAAVDTYIDAQQMIRKRFAVGGKKQGYVRAPSLTTEAELEQFKTTMAALNTGAGVTALAGGADFVSNQLTFAEMDVINVMRDAVRTIATAFNVPAVFMNLEGESSYAERRAADRIFYKGFVHPRASWLIAQIEGNVRRTVDPTLRLSIDKTQIDYIKEELQEEQDRKSKLGIFTVNELRQITGDDPVDGGDEIAGLKPAASETTGTGEPAVDAAVEAAVSAANGKPREVDFNADSSRRRSER